MGKVCDDCSTLNLFCQHYTFLKSFLQIAGTELNKMKNKSMIRTFSFLSETGIDKESW